MGVPPARSSPLAIVDSSGLWFASRTFGMSLVITDIMVWPSERAGGVSSFSLSSDAQLAKVQPEQPAYDQPTPRRDHAIFRSVTTV